MSPSDISLQTNDLPFKQGNDGTPWALYLLSSQTLNVLLSCRIKLSLTETKSNLNERVDTVYWTLQFSLNKSLLTQSESFMITTVIGNLVKVPLLLHHISQQSQSCLGDQVWLLNLHLSSLTVVVNVWYIYSMLSFSHTKVHPVQRWLHLRLSKICISSLCWRRSLVPRICHCNLGSLDEAVFLRGK